jgi:Putative collagen-binding domain of a collagenase
MFIQSKHALDFFYNNSVPFWDMSSENQLLGTTGSNGNWCLAQKNTANVIVVYLREGGMDTIDLNHNYTAKWYNPKTGGVLLDGSLTSLPMGNNTSIGSAPHNIPGQDWVVLLLRVSPAAPESAAPETAPPV